MEHQEHNPGEPEFGEHADEAPHNPGEPRLGDDEHEDQAEDSDEPTGDG